MLLSLARAMSPCPADRQQNVRYIVLDLDETLGDFGDVSYHVNALEHIMNRKMTLKELFALFCSVPQVFRPSTLHMLECIYGIRLQQYHSGVEAGEPCVANTYRVVLYTNNSGRKAWCASICAFLEWYIVNLPQFKHMTEGRAASRLPLDKPWQEMHDRPRSPTSISLSSMLRKPLPRLFDAVIGSYKVGSQINEPSRTTHEKTYEDLCSALKHLNVHCANHSMLFIDDQVHPKMIVPRAVTYFQIPAYRARMDPSEVISSIAKTYLHMTDVASVHESDLHSGLHQAMENAQHLWAAADRLDGDILHVKYVAAPGAGQWQVAGHVYKWPVDGRVVLDRA
jgi:hypothetical protein